MNPLKSLGVALYERVILSYKSTLLGIALAGATEAVNVFTTYLGARPQPWAHLAASLLVLGFSALKSKAVASGITVPPAAGFARIRLLLVMVLFLGALVASVARADEPARTFGGCNKVGTFCYGPTVSISVVGMDVKTGKFTAGVIPGAGYGVTFFADQPYQLGLGGYAAIQSGPDTTSGLFSGIVSFAQYLRVGVGWQVIGGSHSTLALLGLGADLK